MRLVKIKMMQEQHTLNFSQHKGVSLRRTFFHPNMTVTVDAINGLKERAFALGRYL
jgi:hypothetical protein